MRGWGSSVQQKELHPNGLVHRDYEFHQWSNVGCVHKTKTEWYAVMEEIFWRTMRSKGHRYYKLNFGASETESPPQTTRQPWWWQRLFSGGKAAEPRRVPPKEEAHVLVPVQRGASSGPEKYTPSRKGYYANVRHADPSSPPRERDHSYHGRARDHRAHSREKGPQPGRRAHREHEEPAVHKELSWVPIRTMPKRGL